MQHQKRFETNIARSCGIGLRKAMKLVEAGYARLRDIRTASDEELLAVPGIGAGTLLAIRDALGGD